MKFKIDRRKWYRGKGDAESKLLRGEDGKMCCLGQVALQCGIPSWEILNVLAPGGISQKYIGKLPDWIAGVITPDSAVPAMRINDSENLGDKRREVRLKATFKRNGDTITFNH